ncbi:hypothetical protein Syun_007243 [Stephania yunnanensis]|uniref:Uncharacterized protein n=1 Tax=Stephania yunnanensis TaxID=152371 RepID=A0AAP0KY35_9MAGN
MAMKVTMRRDYDFVIGVAVGTMIEPPHKPLNQSSFTNRVTSTATWAINNPLPHRQIRFESQNPM